MENVTQELAEIELFCEKKSSSKKKMQKRS